MNTLQEKVNFILEEKNIKIIPENIKKDITIFGINGEYEGGADTSDATVTIDDLLSGTTAYGNEGKISGNITYTTETNSEVETTITKWNVSTDGIDNVGIDIAPDGTVVKFHDRTINVISSSGNITTYSSSDFGIWDPYSLAKVSINKAPNEYGAYLVVFVVSSSSYSTGTVRISCAYLKDGTLGWQHDAEQAKYRVWTESCSWDSSSVVACNTHPNKFFVSTRGWTYLYDMPLDLKSSPYTNIGANTGGLVSYMEISDDDKFIAVNHIIGEGGNRVMVYLDDDLNKIASKSYANNMSFVTKNGKNYAMIGDTFYYLETTDTTFNPIVKNANVTGLINNNGYNYSDFGKDVFAILGNDKKLVIYQYIINPDDTLLLNKLDTIAVTSGYKKCFVCNDNNDIVFVLSKTQIERYNVLASGETFISSLQRKGHKYYLTTSANTASSEILENKIAYTESGKVIGTMPNNGALEYIPSTKDQSIPLGYTSGGTVIGDENLIAKNIRKDVSIFGVEGELEEGTEDATATIYDIIGPKTAYIKGGKVEGGIIPSYRQAGLIFTPTIQNNTGLGVFDVRTDLGYALVGSRGSTSCYYICKIIDDAIDLDNSVQIPFSSLGNIDNIAIPSTYPYLCDVKFSPGPINEDGTIYLFDVLDSMGTAWGDTWHGAVTHCIKYDTLTDAVVYSKKACPGLQRRNYGTSTLYATYQYKIFFITNDTYIIKPNSYPHGAAIGQRSCYQFNTLTQAFVEKFTDVSATYNDGDASRRLYVEYDGSNYNLYSISDTFTLNNIKSGSTSDKITLVEDNLYILGDKLYNANGTEIISYEHILTPSLYKGYIGGHIYEFHPIENYIDVYSVNEGTYEIQKVRTLSDVFSSFDLNTAYATTQPYMVNDYIIYGIKNDNTIHINTIGFSEEISSLDVKGDIYSRTDDATISLSDVVQGKIAYGPEGKMVGTMPNNGTLNYIPSTVNQTIPVGYTYGGSVAGDINLVAENIGEGISLFGLEGTRLTGNKLIKVRKIECSDKSKLSISMKDSGGNTIPKIGEDSFNVVTNTVTCSINYDGTVKTFPIEVTGNLYIDIYVDEPYKTLENSFGEDSLELTGDLTTYSKVTTGSLSFATAGGSRCLRTNGSSSLRYNFETGINDYEVSFDFYKADSGSYNRVCGLFGPGTEVEIKGSSNVIYWSGTEYSGGWKQNQWNSLKLVKSGSNLTLYINGSTIATKSFSQLLTGIIFGRGHDNTNWFNGWYKNLVIRAKKKIIDEEIEEAPDMSLTIKTIPIVNNVDITKPDSGSYTFTKNANGYYESNNKGVHNSYALAKVTFNMLQAGSFYVDCINYAETSCDYGILSKLDTVLSSSYNTDSSNLIEHSFSGEQSPNVVRITYSNVPAGNHFIYIKYKKDGSVNSYNDSLQFKIITEAEVLNSMPVYYSIEDLLSQKGFDIGTNAVVIENKQLNQAYQWNGEEWIEKQYLAGVDTSDATADESSILRGFTAYVNGQKVTGNVSSQYSVKRFDTIEDMKNDSDLGPGDLAVVCGKDEELPLDEGTVFNALYLPNEISAENLDNTFYLNFSAYSESGESRGSSIYMHLEDTGSSQRLYFGYSGGSIYYDYDNDERVFKKGSSYPDYLEFDNYYYAIPGTTNKSSLQVLKQFKTLGGNIDGVFESIKYIDYESLGMFTNIGYDDESSTTYYNLTGNKFVIDDIKKVFELLATVNLSPNLISLFHLEDSIYYCYEYSTNGESGNYNNSVYNFVRKDDEIRPFIRLYSTSPNNVYVRKYTINLEDETVDVEDVTSQCTKTQSGSYIGLSVNEDCTNTEIVGPYNFYNYGGNDYSFNPSYVLLYLSDTESSNKTVIPSNNRYGNNVAYVPYPSNLSTIDETKVKDGVTVMGANRTVTGDGSIWDNINPNVILGDFYKLRPVVESTNGNIYEEYTKIQSNIKDNKLHYLVPGEGDIILYQTESAKRPDVYSEMDNVCVYGKTTTNRAAVSMDWSTWSRSLGVYDNEGNLLNSVSDIEETYILNGEFYYTDTSKDLYKINVDEASFDLIYSFDTSEHDVYIVDFKVQEDKLIILTHDGNWQYNTITIIHDGVIETISRDSNKILLFKDLDSQDYKILETYLKDDVEVARFCDIDLDNYEVITTIDDISLGEFSFIPINSTNVPLYGKIKTFDLEESYDTIFKYYLFGEFYSDMDSADYLIIDLDNKEYKGQYRYEPSEELEISNVSSPFLLNSNILAFIVNDWSMEMESRQYTVYEKDLHFDRETGLITVQSLNSPIEDISSFEITENGIQTIYSTVNYGRYNSYTFKEKGDGSIILLNAICNSDNYIKLEGTTYEEVDFIDEAVLGVINSFANPEDGEYYLTNIITTMGEITP